jgi:inner membrane protein
MRGGYLLFLPLRRIEPALPTAAMVAAIFALDLLWGAVMGSTGRAAYGLIDEPAHLVTCLVALLAFAAIVRLRPSSSFVAAALIASVAIDVDHIPAYLGWNGLTGALPRPYSHCLLLVLLLLGAAWTSSGRARAISAGLAFGVAAHLFRDLATGPGVPFLWPVSSATITVPYAVYAGSLMAAALVAARRPHSERRGSRRRRSNPQPIAIASPPRAIR